MRRWPPALDRAYAACGALARSHYENFPVASRLLPAAMRPHVAAVYGFARIADDIADEGTLPPAERMERLEAWKRRLHAAVSVEAASAPPHEHEDLIIVAAAHTIRELELPLGLFDDLVSAFGQDITTTRYDTWPQLFDYCRRSANPVGRLVLLIAGHSTDGAVGRSADALCTALQLTNFWQDLGRDWAIGRLYVPRAVFEGCGATEGQLQGQSLTEAWRQSIGECVRVTSDLFVEGRAVCDAVAGRLRYELRLTWLGGRRVLEQVEATAERLMVARPRLGAADAAPILWRLLWWTRG